MSYTVEYFDKHTGKRSYYQHLWIDDQGEHRRMNKQEAIKEFFRFANPDDEVVVLFENTGKFRKGSFNEGAANIGFERAIVARNCSIPARNLVTFCINDSTSPRQSVCSVFLRETSHAI